MEAKGTRLVKRENGYWYIVRTGNSRGISTRTRDLGAAEATLALYLQKRDRKENIPVGLTVHQALDDYITEHVRPNVIATGVITLAADYFRIHFPIDKLVADIREEDIDDPRTGQGYIQRRQRQQLVLKRENPRPASDGTLRREIGALSAAFAHAARKRRIGKGQIPYLTQPRSPPPRNRWLTLEEEEQLIAACAIDEADELRRKSENIRRALGSQSVARPTSIRPIDRHA